MKVVIRREQNEMGYCVRPHQNIHGAYGSNVFGSVQHTFFLWDATLSFYSKAEALWLNCTC